MNYYDLSKNFWYLYRDKAFGYVDTAIYFYLLNECNIRRWLNPFELQTRNLELMFGISRKTIVEARNRLKQRGVIDFIEGKGRGAAIYKIVGLEVTNDTLEKEFCVTFCVSPRKHEGNTKGNTKVTQKVTQTGNSPLNIKDIRHKTKDSIASCDAAAPVPPPEEKGLFDDEEKRESKRKQKSAKAPPNPPPTYDEVREYFLSQEADRRLGNWEDSCRRFYDNFTAVDWRDKYNRRITRWDSRANGWILDDEMRQKENSHEIQNQSRADRPAPPSSGVSIRGRITPKCGLKRGDPSGKA